MGKFVQKINAVLINKRTLAISHSLAAHFDKLLLDWGILDYSRFCCTCGHLTHIQHCHVSKWAAAAFPAWYHAEWYFLTGLGFCIVEDSWRDFWLVMSFELLYCPKLTFSGASLRILKGSLPKIISFHRCFTWVYLVSICRLFMVRRHGEDRIFILEHYALWFLFFPLLAEQI